MSAPSRPIDLDSLDMHAIRAGALRDQPVTVLGLARSGLALARFLADAGAQVTVYDGRGAEELTPADRAWRASSFRRQRRSNDSWIPKSLATWRAE